MAMRSLNCVHGAYVLHNDLAVWTNFLAVPNATGDPERVVAIDLDHAKTARNGVVPRMALLEELAEVWGMFYSRALARMRITCEEAEHPHQVRF
ncbi:hypothetical protein BD413DRAFT_607689 [Trametes elegans]|nr:hypothetical protein BD413DRAFT_607689 [Trametes elegans]